MATVQSDFVKSPQDVEMGEFVNILDKALNEGEISWLITDKKSFEWQDMNIKKQDFLKQLSGLKFKEAFVGVYYPSVKKIEYSSFKIR